MNTRLARFSLAVLLAGTTLFLIGGGMVAGVAMFALNQPDVPAMELPLYATATDTGETISMATGPINGEMEGTFFLDFITGTLSCVVMNSRKADLVAGIFSTNVIKDLGIDEAKKPAYLMTTAQATFVGQKRGAADLARCIVFVCDENTGKFVGYTLYWDNGKAAKGILQIDGLVKIVANNGRAVKPQQ